MLELVLHRIWEVGMYSINTPSKEGKRETPVFHMDRYSDGMIPNPASGRLSRVCYLL
jgi:hypothetical protein